MRVEYNIYCDESCHLSHDDSKAMVLGAVWCPLDKRKEIFTRIREIKAKYNFKPGFEIKWNKVSKGRVDFYLDIINYFFDDDDLHFRALIVPDKKALDHSVFNQYHDTFYYKMYFDMLKVILSPHCAYNIYIDIKDTRGNNKVLKLKEVLRNNHYDFQKQIIKNVQQVHSSEVEILQITDLLIGAIGYLHRGLNENSGKLKIIERVRQCSGYSLKQSTLYKEEKVNIFIWKHRIIT
ncbi:MAG: DUF3800 domain-containing protein [Bacteroidetes bacterium]|nr:DUF3800 domain-containing protein [Bacteroidota bacterium]